MDAYSNDQRYLAVDPPSFNTIDPQMNHLLTEIMKLDRKLTELDQKFNALMSMTRQTYERVEHLETSKHEIVSNDGGTIIVRM